jgi:hypothetical protein
MLSLRVEAILLHRAVAGFVVQLLTGTYVVLTPKQEAKVRRKLFEEAHPDASRLFVYKYR